jgi:hypothetical protein
MLPFPVYWQSLSDVYPAPTTILIQSQSIGNQSLVYILLLLQYQSSPRLLAITLWCISCSYYNTNPVLVYWQSISGVYPAPTTILLLVLDYWQLLSGVYPAPITILSPDPLYWQSLSGVHPSRVTILSPVPIYWQSLSGTYPAPITILLPVLD